MLEQVRKTVHGLLDPGVKITRADVLVNGFLLLLILANVLAVLLESFRELRLEYAEEFYTFEVFSVLVFTVEYILRIWSIGEDTSGKYRGWRGRLRFIRSPMGIVDLLAILPFYLSFFVPVYDLRILRILRIFRMLKLARYSRSMDLMMTVIKREGRPLLAALFIMLFALITASTLMYLIENEAQPDKFGSIPLAMWWGVATLTTVGYGDVVPITPVGKVLGTLIALAGVGLFALPAGIIVSGFMDEMKKRDFLVSWNAVAALPIFSGLDAVQIAEIVEQLQYRTVERGEIIFSKGDDATGMYFIATGQLEVRLPGARARRLGEGAAVGEIGLLKDTTRTATVAATTKTRLMFLERSDFEELMERHPSIRKEIEHDAAERLAELEALSQSSPES